MARVCACVRDRDRRAAIAGAERVPTRSVLPLQRGRVCGAIGSLEIAQYDSTARGAECVRGDVCVDEYSAGLDQIFSRET
jgi:hypothetical protein